MLRYLLMELARLIKALHYSISGLSAAYRNEPSFRHELIIAVVSFPVAMFIAKDMVELGMLISSGMMVFMAELFNSAIEAVVDRIGREYHPLSGRAKDLGSAAVFMAGLNAAFVWGGLLIR